MKKRIISLVLAIALMLFGTVAVASAQTTTACGSDFLNRFLSNCSNSATAASCSELMSRFVNSNGQLCSQSGLNDDLSAALVNSAKSSCPSSAVKAALAATDDSSSDQNSAGSDQSTGTCSNGSTCKDNVCSNGSTCKDGVCSDGSTCTNGANGSTGTCSNGSTCKDGVCSDGSTCTNGANDATGTCSNGSTCKDNVCSNGSTSTSGGSTNGSTCTNGSSSCPTNVAGNTSCPSGSNLYDIVCNLLKGCGLSVSAGNTCKNNTGANANPNSGSSAQTPAPTTAPTQGSSTNADNLSYEEQVLKLVNEQRASNGLSALTLNASISNLARAKSQDMHDKNYFSHTSPTYGSAFDMLKAANISYRTAGENIAMGYATPQAVVNAWMNSPGHRANILNSGYTQLGVGYVADGSYWTQIFVG